MKDVAYKVVGTREQLARIRKMKENKLMVTEIAFVMMVDSLVSAVKDCDAHAPEIKKNRILSDLTNKLTTCYNSILKHLGTNKLDNDVINKIAGSSKVDSHLVDYWLNTALGYSSTLEKELVKYN